MFINNLNSRLPFVVHPGHGIGVKGDFGAQGNCGGGEGGGLKTRKNFF